ncbi:MAG: hypothetical protein NT027_12175 [Proteobacteria bacterium]|nr:hypothetical protein [Pseudomonadota bacterium]
MQSRPTHLILVDMEPLWVDVSYREILDDFSNRRFDSLDAATDWCNSCQSHQVIVVTSRWFDQQMHSAIQVFLTETSTVVEVLVLTSGVLENVWQSLSDARIEILLLPSSPAYLEARLKSKRLVAKQRLENTQTQKLLSDFDFDFDLCLASLVHEVSNFCQVLGSTVYLMSQQSPETTDDLDLHRSANEKLKSFELQKDVLNLQSQIDSLNLYVHSFADGLRSLQGQNNFQFKTWASTLQKVVQVLQFQIAESGAPRRIEYTLPTKFHSFYAHEGLMLFLLFNVVYNSVKHARVLECLHVDISEKEVEIEGKKFVELVQIIGPEGFDFLTIKAAEIVGEFIETRKCRTCFFKF